MLDDFCVFELFSRYYINKKDYRMTPIVYFMTDL